MEFNSVYCVFMCIQIHKFLIFKLRIQTPKLYWLISGSSRDIWSVRLNLSTHWVKAYVDHSIGVTFKLSAKLAIRHAPNSTQATPATRCKQLLVRWETPTTNTTIISVLWFNHLVRADTVNFWL
jgi:hypothetical protein